MTYNRVQSEKKILAWHFVSENRKLRYGCDLLVEPGYIYSEPTGDLSLCNFGMHASVQPLDALEYAPGPIVCRVRVWGDVINGGDKLVARHREVLWMADATRTLREFACWCVRETPLADGRKVWDLLMDERSRKAVEVAERFARGEATHQELAAARDAAGDATWDAAWAAAWAARDAARAARDAAGDAAGDAAWDAASAAASAAASTAARGVAWATARGVARAAQNKRLGEMLEALR